jgi:hypothetical protein
MAHIVTVTLAGGAYLGPSKDKQRNEFRKLKQAY